jgi:eukaryotic-like serine/threonine-protein kinase
MRLAAGSRLGAYEVVAQIGAGGMGEVYRAHDEHLKRDVAIKVLPSEFALDVDRLARFKREAQLLASLNHPNIAAIYGFDQVGDTQTLVLELVEGDTLTNRIARGPMPIDETLPIAKQIAEALEAAHEQGIIHRDLKPSNIKVRPDGSAKVLDFGLAKAVDPSPNATDVAQSPTITSPAMTRMGVILGTAAYMSPEQARGKTLDKRTDIWSFACVLYEMLTGRRAFGGDGISDTLVFILSKEPDWSALPSAAPAGIRRLLSRCLQKDPRRRLRDIGDARLEIERLLAGAPEDEAAPAIPPGPAHGRRERLVWAAASLALGAIVAGLATWVALRPAPGAAALKRFVIPVSGLGAVGSTALGRHVVTLSPDGRHLVFVANRRLYLRPLNRLEAVPMGGTEGNNPTHARDPFFSPDGEWIGFWHAGRLKKIPVGGGAPVTLCEADQPFGATWGEDGTILFGQGSRGIWQVPATGGGAPVQAIRVQEGEQAHGPQRLPGGGDWVLFTLRPANPASWDSARGVVQSTSTGERKVLIEGGTDVRYLPTGHLMYVLRGTVLAVPFDVARRAVLGGPVALVEGVMQVTGQTGAAQFSVSRDGTLAYLPATAGATAQRALVWVDRRGREELVGAPARVYVGVALSPDGTRVALGAQDEDNDIWIWNFARRTFTRFTFDPGAEGLPLWSPDGRRIVFFARGTAGSNLFWQTADAAGAPERLTASQNLQVPNSFSHGGDQLVLHETDAKTGTDLRLLSLEGDRRTEVLVQTTFNERNGEISPDGRWIAYDSNESGRTEVYVRPFPSVHAGRWQISTGGGVRPIWAPSSRELFYVAPGETASRMMTVPVQTATVFSHGSPEMLFEGRYFLASTNRTYAVASDGQRFLMVKEGDTSTDTAAQVVVVENWIEEVKRLVPVK